MENDERPQELSFEKAEFGDSAAQQLSCWSCKRDISGEYYLVNEAPYCASCRDALNYSSPTEQLRTGGLARAALYGLGAAAVGTAIWLGILWAADLEIGLIAILVGWMVGKAVFVGSGDRGGLRYQILAVALTYTSICASYAPLLVGGMSSYEQPQTVVVDGQDRRVILGGSTAESPAVTPEQAAAAIPAPEDGSPLEEGKVYLVPTSWEETETDALRGVVGIAVVFGIALAMPFLMGFENIIGLLIIGFGLWQAWKANEKRVLEVEGPFRSDGSAAAGAG